MSTPRLRIVLNGQELSPDEYVLDGEFVKIHLSVLASRGSLPDHSRVYGDPTMRLGEYLGFTCGLLSSTSLYDLGLTREHAHAVWYGRERLTEAEMSLIHQVYGITLETLTSFNDAI